MTRRPSGDEHPSPPSPIAPAPAARRRRPTIPSSRCGTPISTSRRRRSPAPRAAIDDPGVDERTRAWAELTVGWHQLYFTSDPAAAAPVLPVAQQRFERLGDRRGELLTRIGTARVLLVTQRPLEARSQLLEFYDEAIAELPPQDRFWAINALGATYYYEDRIDETIRYMHLALETLRTIDVSPHLATAMSNLAAALVTVGDYAPARELAQDAIGMLPRYDNPQLWLFVRLEPRGGPAGDRRCRGRARDRRRDARRLVEPAAQRRAGPLPRGRGRGLRDARSPRGRRALRARGRRDPDGVSGRLQRRLRDLGGGSAGRRARRRRRRDRRARPRDRDRRAPAAHCPRYARRTRPRRSAWPCWDDGRTRTGGRSA
ncbi:MAG: tetratricopeptide repeat protein [Betaproteobacteria bacterium]|nr:tetratricopeptide repeat protein [Betaproteobacteria bacterium]